MGIQNFWSIIESSGRNVSIEYLRGQRLAVDISIWLNQIVRAMRTKTGETIPNAHIYITVFRICKLLFYGIKPVIVFDGNAPSLKKRTLAKRREKAKKAEEKMDRLRDAILAVNAVEQIKSNKSSIEENITNPKLPIEEEDTNTIEQNEMALETLYNRNIVDNEIIYVDLSYKDEVLHIAANSPQLLSVPKHLRSRVIGLLKSQLQNRALKMLDSVAGDTEEVSKMQMRVNHFRTKVIREVAAILRSEEEAEIENRHTVERNGYEYYYHENNNPFDEQFFDDLMEEEKEEEKQEIPDELFIRDDNSVDKFEEKRQRMNNDFFKSLSEWNYGENDVKKEEKEKEEGKVLLYTNISELMDNRDLSVQSYGIEKVHFSSKENEVSFITMMEKAKEEREKKEEVEEIDPFEEYKRYCKKLEEGRKRRREEKRKEKEEDECGDDLIIEMDDDGELFVDREESVKKEDEEEEEEEDGIEGKEDEEEEEEIEEIEKKELEFKEAKEIEVVDVESDKKKEEEEKREEENTIEIQEAKREEEEEEVKEIEEILTEEEIEELLKEEEKEEVKTKQQTSDTTPSQLQEQANKLFSLSLTQLQQHKQSLFQQYQHYSSQNAYVSEDIIIDILQILHIFGIPYLFAPGEAEAQCSYLEMMGLVDGIISNDSDIFGFGGKTVYKDFFTDNQYIQEYRSEDIEKEKGLTRERIIEFALLHGCDYCEGVPGVGKITAVELISFFPSFSALRELPVVIKKDEWKEYREKLEKYNFPEGFVDNNVINAYMFPAVDSSMDAFEWSEYDEEKMKAFLQNHPSVNESRLRNSIKPALRNQKKEKQLQITDLLTYSKKSLVKKERSKRLQAAFKRLIDL